MRADWYVIAWRLLWAIPFYVSAVLCCFFVLLMWGPGHAKSVWSEIT